MLRLRVNMTIVLQTTNLLAHPPQSIFPGNPTRGTSPFVSITVPPITAELEENGDGHMAQSLVTSPPNVPKQKDPPPSCPVPNPVPADYPLPHLETLRLPNNQSATRLQFFVQNWKKITQDSWTLQTAKG